MATLTYADLVCVDDFDPLGAETTSDLQNFEQDIYHRLLQPWGSNADDPDAGAGLQGAIASSPTQTMLQNKIATEIRKDPRAVSSTVTVSKISVEGAPAYQIDIAIDTNDDALETAVQATANQTTLISGVTT